MKKLFATGVILLTIMSSYGQQLPDFHFQNARGEVVSQATLPEGQPLVIFFFDLYCDACQQQAEWISAHLDAFQDVTLLWVMYGPITEPEPFVEFKNTYFKDAPNVLFCADGQFMFDIWFGYSEAGSLFIYDESRNFLAKAESIMPASSSLKVMGK